MVLQFTTSLTTPRLSQARTGSGFVQLLVLIFVPVSQDFVHVSHAPHDNMIPPSTSAGNGAGEEEQFKNQSLIGISEFQDQFSNRNYYLRVPIIIQ